MLSYRKELDGIRALAVFAVILYHANFQMFGDTVFKGGYLGVDVFFVLSGYLITGIIRDKLQKESFSLLDFYWRRFKRIVPALLFVLIVTSALAYFILKPDSIIAYVKSLKSALYFGSNYYFLSEDSYVAESSIRKPLLHTWSLAVEWQFYMFFPLLILLINKFLKKYTFGIILILLIASMQYANIVVETRPDDAFYLLPSRAWELFAGGLLTFFDRRNLENIKDGTISSMLVKSMPIIGLFLVIHGMIFFGHSNPHPSFLTAVPVFGICLFILFTTKGDITNSIFSSKPVVFIGLISYSLYLWHQPVFVFFRLLKHDEINNLQLLMLISISLLLSVISYYLIENKFRVKKLGKNKISILIIMFLSLIVFYGITIYTNGFSSKFEGKQKDANEIFSVLEFRKLKDESNPGIGYFSKEPQELCNKRTVDSSCKFGDQKWINLGDSFSGQLDPELKKILEKKGHGFISMTYEQCPFVSPDIWFGKVPECSLINEERIKFLSNLVDKKNIIVTANYWQFSQPKKRIAVKGLSQNKLPDDVVLSDDIAWKSYAENINLLIEKGHEVYVIYPLPAPVTDVRKSLFEQINGPTSSYHDEYTPNVNAYSDTIKLSNKLDEFLQDNPRLHKVYTDDIFCKNEKCLIINKDGAIYSSGGHLTDVGARMVLNKFL
ncbi:acyltransferase family protein [Proteus appendicitidis]|uniref:Acyltransferase family protein n=1 Tax=Proteus appendicitidis TaxID=3034648 RepID=A0ABY8Y478_9GAMM|nr:acyltransferase family protein [Proteus sp. HZ0627]WIV87091.1 acyltransferase family protein [Proteus sp. HZ0627]